MTTKEVFLKESELRDKLMSVTHSDWFKRCIVFARSRISESGASTEEIRGANNFIRALFELPEEEPEETPVDMGLDHAIDSPRPPVVKKRKSRKS